MSQEIGQNKNDGCKKLSTRIKPLWFVIYSQPEESVSLVYHEDVLCDSSVQVRDKVNFYYNNKSYEGIVEAVGDNYDMMRKEQEQINKLKKPREPSFHAERPRSAKLSCVDLLSSKQKAGKAKKTANTDQQKADTNDSSPQHEKEQAADPSRSILGKVLDAEEIYTDSEKEDEAEDEGKIREALLKLSRKGKLNDLRALMELPNSAPSTSTGVRNDPKQGQIPERGAIEEAAPSDGRRSPPSPLAPKRAKQPQARRKAYTKLEYNGQFFNYKEDDDEVYQLSPKYKVFGSSTALSEVKGRRLKSPTAYARSVVPLVFTLDAMKECSVTGRPSAGKGRENMTLRPPLHPDGVGAIFEYAISRAVKKNWPKPTITEVKRAIGDVLNEGRHHEMLRKRNEEEHNKNLQPETPKDDTSGDQE